MIIDLNLKKNTTQLFTNHQIYIHASQTHRRRHVVVHVHQITPTQKHH